MKLNIIKINHQMVCHSTFFEGFPHSLTSNVESIVSNNSNVGTNFLEFARLVDSLGKLFARQRINFIIAIVKSFI
jgi:hypothetical protein